MRQIYLDYPLLNQSSHKDVVQYRNKCYTWFVTLVFAITLLFSYSQDTKGHSVSKQGQPTGSQTVRPGEFTVSLPSNWTPFANDEKERLSRSVQQQAKAIYERYTGNADPGKSLDFIAFHTPGQETFIATIYSIPPRADLMSDLIKDIPEKAKWGIEQGYIKTSYPLTLIDRDGFTGFYLETESMKGSYDFVGGLVHSRHKTDVFKWRISMQKANPRQRYFRKYFPT